MEAPPQPSRCLCNPRNLQRLNVQWALWTAPLQGPPGGPPGAPQWGAPEVGAPSDEGPPKDPFEETPSIRLCGFPSVEEAESCSISWGLKIYLQQQQQQQQQQQKGREGPTGDSREMQQGVFVCQ